MKLKFHTNKNALYDISLLWSVIEMVVKTKRLGLFVEGGRHFKEQESVINRNDCPIPLGNGFSIFKPTSTGRDAYHFDLFVINSKP